MFFLYLLSVPLSIGIQHTVGKCCSASPKEEEKTWDMCCVGHSRCCWHGLQAHAHGEIWTWVAEKHDPMLYLLRPTATAHLELNQLKKIEMNGVRFFIRYDRKRPKKTEKGQKSPLSYWRCQTWRTFNLTWHCWLGKKTQSNLAEHIRMEKRSELDKEARIQHKLQLHLLELDPTFILCDVGWMEPFLITPEQSILS